MKVFFFIFFILAAELLKIRMAAFKKKKKKWQLICCPHVPGLSQCDVEPIFLKRWNSKWKLDFSVQSLERTISCSTDNEWVADFVEPSDASLKYEKREFRLPLVERKTFYHPSFHLLGQVWCDDPILGIYRHLLFMLSLVYCSITLHTCISKHRYQRGLMAWRIITRHF